MPDGQPKVCGLDGRVHLLPEKKAERGTAAGHTQGHDCRLQVMTATTAGKVWREWRGWPGSETWRPCEAVLQRCSMRGPRPCWLAGGPAGPPECQVCPALAHLRIAGGRCEGRGPAAGQGRAAPDQGMHMHTQHSSKASCPLLELAAAPRGRGWAPLCLPAAAAISASSRAAATATEPSGRQAGCCHSHCSSCPAAWPPSCPQASPW